MKKFLREKIKKLPKKPGAYLFKDKNGRIIYIGKAVNLKKRVQQHFRNTNYNSPQPPLTLRGGGISDIDFIRTKNENQAMILENELIKKYQPKYNIQWRDDKSYFWVNFTDDEWPRVQVAHKNKLNPPQSPFTKGGASPLLKRGVGGDFFGPYVSGRELRKTLRALRKILPFRTCKNPYDKPCLQWHLELCPAHKNRLSPIAYSQSLNSISQFLRLYAGEKIRIEAYDISNIQGKYATGSMIVFSGSKPSKKDYRKFRIKSVQGANDVAMIREVLNRRFNHPEWPYPDLILIDGGIAQLNAARQIANSQWPIANAKTSLPYAISHTPLAIVSLAKKEEEIYTEYSAKPLKISALPQSLRLTFQAIRNEAHRFAIFYYRYLHRKHAKFQYPTNPGLAKRSGAGNNQINLNIQ